MVFFNTLSESLERLTKALLCLPSGAVEYLLHDYGQRLVPAVDAYIKKCANRQLQTTQTAWYNASKELVATFSTEPPAGIQLRSLNTADATTINENWPYGSKDSVQFVKRLIDYNVSIGAYDAHGKLVAWCLRLPIGALGLLQVLESHKRLGLGSLMHSSNDKADVFFNTLNGSLTELQALLGSLKLNSRHWFCGYRHLLKNIVDKYCVERRLKLTKLEHLETFVYYLPQSAFQPFDCRLIADISFGPLDIKHASQVDEHWPHRSSDSLALISDRIRNYVSVGAFDRDGQLLAWCLRSSQGGLSNLHVLPPHRRLGLASLLVRFMAQEIAATGAEVLATIAFGNKISQIFFEKLGFKLIDNIYFTTVPAL
ncbi:uncharacterized protein LOC135430289 isoform X2 [Drosophila montana]